MENLKTVLSGANSTYLLALLGQYQNDPDSVPQDWRPVLNEMISEYGAMETRPTWGQSFTKTDDETMPALSEKESLGNIAEGKFFHDMQLNVKVQYLIQAYRFKGHLSANLDPLGMAKTTIDEELTPAYYGFTEEDYNKTVYVNGAFGAEKLLLSELLTKLKNVYCGHMTAEYMHITHHDSRLWVQNRLEKNNFRADLDTKHTILQQLTEAEFFERFIHKKFPGAKRFGLDGGESLIPALKEILNLKTKKGSKNFVFGMAHRGRLSTLAHVLGKPMHQIFAQFEGISKAPDNLPGSGDVKYHLGFSSNQNINGQTVHLSLLPNPSHLESINPVVLGKVYGQQALEKDGAKKKTVGILIHGDAAFSGQGVVFESLNLCGLLHYKTGGTFHIIVNNQIGFTTSPQQSRPYQHSSDISKFIQAPIFHVNADNPEAVLNVVEMACDYHETFGHDVIIDLICYRRHGHNEGDEPAFTQPNMYETIKNHPSTRALYEQRLIAQKNITEADAQIVRDDINYKIQNEFKIVHDAKTDGTTIEANVNWKQENWSYITQNSSDESMFKQVKTGLNDTTIQNLGKKIFSGPSDFHVHPKIRRQWNEKLEALKEGGPIDWQLAEAFAFAGCLTEGHPVRLSGQDCERGTFSHRHAVVIDQETEEKYISLNNLTKDQAPFEIVNSPLSEFAILGFEYGYSLSNPNALVMWEAQFGDFANGAQVIVDQFISSAESKWLRLSSLVMMLPHGFEGQGPEHSSARIERYLQLCAENNMIVANCSTPANYFHLLRRQIKADYRKPLIVFTPKSLLRHKHCVSSIQDFNIDIHFKPIIMDTLPPKKVRKIIFCSGKVYYDLLEYRTDNNIQDVALMRLEQYHPFPAEQLIKVLKAYDPIPLLWCQEEPKNMGAWHFVDRRLEDCLTKVHGKLVRPLYVGRPDFSSPATGYSLIHKAEQTALIEKAFS
ncbi:MAG TPA: 2-oxoglutarate dehydrogenase E1 component [Holosporales bacterium]|nr:2-oxoglutarate dehydrogenase E1 component [Holosporales bacterium]